MVPDSDLQSRTIASYASPRAYGPHVRIALKGLGYRVVQAATQGAFGDASWAPDLRIADERLLSRIPTPPRDPKTPIVVLTGARAKRSTDPRIVGTVQRPAGLRELYCLMQLALEPHPRGAPRAPTQLPARCVQADQRWLGAVMALSEKGCLFRTSESVSKGMRMSLQFALPFGDLISARAECVHRTGENAGIAFAETSALAREAIGRFVTHRLACLPEASD